MESAVEAAFKPGRFIAWNEGASFVAGLRQIQDEIQPLVATEPARAVVLYETLLAGCFAKAEEVDDSDGEFGSFPGGLFLDWIRARQVDCAEWLRDGQTLLTCPFISA